MLCGWKATETSRFLKGTISETDVGEKLLNHLLCDFESW
jgi:hypothetical protein